MWNLYLYFIWRFFNILESCSFVNCPTSSMYVTESIVFGMLMELCFSGYKAV